MENGYVSSKLDNQNHKSNLQEGKYAVENYRGIITMNTAYKLYAMILEDKLRVETESKTILPNLQTGFRKEKHDR